jgi:hypothetical protein
MADDASRGERPVAAHRRHVRVVGLIPPGEMMKNACRGSGFDVRPSRPFLAPGERTECSWCHRMVAVTRTMQLRAHSTAAAPERDGLRRSLPASGRRRAGESRW